MSDNDDLIKALEAMGRFEHDDLSLGTEAAEALTSLQERVDVLKTLLKDAKWNVDYFVQAHKEEQNENVDLRKKIEELEAIIKKLKPYETLSKIRAEDYDE